MAITSNLLCLSSHTVDESMMPNRPTVLDVGARGFQFCHCVRAIRPGAGIFAVEADPNVQPDDSVDMFASVALVGDDRAESQYASFSTGEANFLSDGDIHYAKMLTVPCLNITTLMKRFNIWHWDLVKLDCEGSEFGILENWPGPIATQISVEFHDYTNLERWDAAYFARLFAGPLKNYRVVQHEMTSVGPGRNRGHWDSLLVLNQCELQTYDRSTQ